MGGKGPGSRVAKSVRSLERPCELLDFVGFQNIPFLYVVKARQADAAFQSFADLFDVFFFTTQRIERIVSDTTSIAIDTDSAAPLDVAGHDPATGDRSDFADGEGSLDERPSQLGGPPFWIKLTFQ